MLLIAKLTTENRLISDSTIYVSIIYIQINLHGIKIIPYICRHQILKLNEYENKRGFKRLRL